MVGLAINSILKVEFPFGQHRFYSEDVISDGELVSAILEVMNKLPGFDSSQFDRESMHLKVDQSKVMSFGLTNQAKETEELVRVRENKLKSNIGTQIDLDVQRSVPGTELCIEILKNIQKKYPRSVFVDDHGIFVGGDDIQRIWMDKDFMYDPGIRKLLENQDISMPKR